MIVVVHEKGGNEFCVKCEENFSVEQLKKQIYIFAGHQIENQRLIRKGKILHNSEILRDLEIKDMSKVYLVARNVKKPKQEPKQGFDLFDTLMKSPSDSFTKEILSLAHKMKEKNPEIQNSINDDDTIEELIQTMKDPSARLERLRSIDRIMNANEMICGGYKDIIHQHYMIEDLYDDMLDDHCFSKPTIPTVIPEKLDCPSNTQLPIYEDEISRLLSWILLMARIRDTDASMESHIPTFGEFSDAQTITKQPEFDQVFHSTPEFSYTPNTYQKGLKKDKNPPNDEDDPIFDID